MISIARLLGRLLAAVTVLVAVAIGQSACAQGPFGRDLLVPAGPSPTILNDESQVDQWAFGGQDADEFRHRLERRLTARVNEINRICTLTEAQKKKLYVAGGVDIRRYFDDVEKFKQTIRDHRIDRPLEAGVFQDFQPSVTIQRRSFFADDSLLGKILRNTLGSEQFARYERIKLEERAARHQATLKWVVGILDTTLHLSAEQHRRLAALLAEETRPPRTFGEYDYYGVMLQVSRLSEARVKPIFNPDQWAKLQVQLKHASRLKPTLERGGFIPEDGVAAQAPAPPRNDAVIEPKDHQG